MKYSSSFIIIAFFLLWNIPGVFAMCELDTGITPKLSEYQKNIQASMNALKNTKNNCGLGEGSIRQLNKTRELYDKAMISLPLYNDIVLDFQYSTNLALRGEQRHAVILHGELFEKILKNTINPTIESLEATCNLTPEIETRIITLIKYNYLLEKIYKKTALGEMISLEEVPQSLIPVAEEIQIKYNPEATKSCKNEVGFEETISKTFESFSKGTFGIENAWKDWQEAIALFSGKSLSVKYQDLKRRLLQRELARQGMSKNASEVILGNLDCVQSRQNGESLDEELRAIADCKKMPILGIDKLRDELNKSLTLAPNRDVYLGNMLLIDEKITDSVNIELLHKNLLGQVSNRINTDEKIRNNLINMHIRLLSTNNILEKRIPPMQKNCMKALPGIVGGCRD